MKKLIIILLLLLPILGSTQVQETDPPLQLEQWMVSPRVWRQYKRDVRRVHKYYRRHHRMPKHIDLRKYRRPYVIDSTNIHREFLNKKRGDL